MAGLAIVAPVLLFDLYAAQSRDAVNDRHVAMLALTGSPHNEVPGRDSGGRELAVARRVDLVVQGPLPDPCRVHAEARLGPLVVEPQPLDQLDALPFHARVLPVHEVLAGRVLVGIAVVVGGAVRHHVHALAAQPVGARDDHLVERRVVGRDALDAQRGDEHCRGDECQSETKVRAPPDAPGRVDDRIWAHSPLP